MEQYVQTGAYTRKENKYHSLTKWLQELPQKTDQSAL